MNRPGLRGHSREKSHRVRAWTAREFRLPVPLGRNRGSQSRGRMRVIVEAHLHCRHIVGFWLHFTSGIWLVQL